MTKRGTLWIPVDTELLDPVGNRHSLDDPSVLAYLRLIAWSKRQRTDGYVPRAIADRILNGTRARLVEAQLVQVVDDEVHVLDYLKWNPSSDDVTARREAARERKRRSRGSALGLKDRDRDRDRDNRVTPRGVTAMSQRDIRRDPVDNHAWAVECEHGAPYRGRNCPECHDRVVADAMTRHPAGTDRNAT